MIGGLDERDARFAGQRCGHFGAEFRMRVDARSNGRSAHGQFQNGLDGALDGWTRLSSAAPDTAAAQTEPEDASASKGGADPEDGRRTLERFDVKLLARGVLLEARDDESAVSTIEISRGELAADGEVVAIDELRESLGEADSYLVLQLSGLEEAELRRLFADELSQVAVIAEVVADEDEVPEEVEEVVASIEKKLKRKDTQVVFGTSLTVEEDEIAREAVVFGAPLTIRGKVRGDAAAIGSTATISGQVTGDAVAVGGSIYLEDGAEVSGDVVAVGGRIEESGDVEVGGQKVEVPFGKDFPFWRIGAGPFFRPHDWRDSDDWHFGPMDVAMSAAWEGFALIIFLLFRGGREFGPGMGPHHLLAQVDPIDDTPVELENIIIDTP